MTACLTFRFTSNVDIRQSTLATCLVTVTLRKKQIIIAHVLLHHGSRCKSCHILTFRKTYMEKNEKTVERARQMLTELTMAGVPMTKVAKGAGVNGVTLWQLKKGGQSRISERVFDSIWDFWSEHAPPRANGQSVDGNEAATGAVEATQAAEVGEPSPAPTKTVGGPSKAAAGPKSTKGPKINKPVTSGQKAAGSGHAGLSPLNIDGLLNRDYVPVDMKALVTLIDGMIARFEGQIEELEVVRRLLK
jgi:lambda repressor-like predicted transcriptional regulator